MGRKKPGKPRRPRNTTCREYTLQELRPPGDAYDEWYTVNPDMSAEQVAAMGVDPEALDIMRRMARLGPLYNGELPKAALLLDQLIDTGHLPLLSDDEEGILMSLETMVPAQASGDPDSIRESVHNLHSVGALLVVTDEKHDMPFVRLVAKRPDHPGDRWYFEGDPDAVTSKVCLPDGMHEELSLELAGTVTYMRAMRARLQEPDPAVYGTHKGVNGTEHAKELFAAALASGYVDVKGCEACPAGHLCTRKD